MHDKAEVSATVAATRCEEETTCPRWSAADVVTWRAVADAPTTTPRLSSLAPPTTTSVIVSSRATLYHCRSPACDPITSSKGSTGGGASR